MSGLALILKNDGAVIYGSDMTKTELTEDLEKKGIIINYNHDESNITEDIDLVVYTAAIHENNKEFKKSKELGLKMMVRSKLLGEIMKQYNNRINIAGTHGKTTTTSMISKLMVDMNIEPTITVGAIYKYINGNVKIGDKNYFVNEACEYTNSFLDFYPNIEIITNIEEDHLDFFKDINDIRNSFRLFIEKMDENGILVINKNIDNIDELVKNYKGKIITYGFNEDSDYYAKNIIFDYNDFAKYDLYAHNKKIANIKLNVLGKHNVENSVAAIALGLELGFDINEIIKSIESFNGADRRLENKGCYKGITIFDDYAHHPSEINASINALKSIQKNKLYIVYQPHTYTRTKALFNEFVEALKVVDDLILIDIYPAREQNIFNISSKDIVDEINKKYNKNAKYLATFDEASDYILKNITDGDIVVSMGAGDVYKVTNCIIDKLK